MLGNYKYTVNLIDVNIKILQILIVQSLFNDWQHSQMLGMSEITDNKKLKMEANVVKISKFLVY